ncbi:thrombospondin type 3 repeat-containing protein [Candidatus Pacebacteria bacterium]|nr:thrombospondin type 3 repeat-containing protein [Candidatus Paceibacterota bacterium]
MKKLITLLFVGFFFTTSGVFAQETNPKTAFQNYKVIPPTDVVVPTVVGVPIEGGFYKKDTFLVYENETDTYVHSYFKKEYTAEDTVLISQTIPSNAQSYYLTDRDLDTAVDFDVPENGNGVVRIILNTPNSITTSQLKLNLAQYVSLPLTVEIKAHTANGLKTIVATKRMGNGIITFPETTANSWEVSFTYAQPLRVAEIALLPSEIKTSASQTLRFLAQPNMSYEVYFNADRYVQIHTAEGGDLRSDVGVLVLPPFETMQNPRYIPADIDDDGVRDVFDNCVRAVNPDQLDIDKNGRGDACDDFDKDGRMNNVDNCPNQPNANQSDEDGDGVGDVCDGEESRFTERHVWVPWVGMGIAGLVLLVLFMLVAIGTKERERIEAEDE